MKKILAALIFFTRLPFLRSLNIPQEYFKNVVNYWTFIGLITGGLMALIFWTSTYIFPVQISAIIAISFRLFLTGALHEDGFADFFDGFGGGTNKERILTIMKDSHVGSYGLISLIIYFLLLYSILILLPIKLAPLIIISADIWSKFIASWIITLLPYAKDVQQSKNKFIYNKPSLLITIISSAFSVLILFITLPRIYLIAAIAPILVLIIMIRLMKNKIGGYTGDCCGASFLLCELSFYLTALVCASMPLLKRLSIFACVCIIATSCFNNNNSHTLPDKINNPTDTISKHKETLKYAKGFDIEYNKDYIKVNIKDPWDSLKILQTYILVDKNQKLENLPNGVIVKTPIDKIVVYSSVHASIIELLGCTDKIIGVCEAKYIESPQIIKAIKNKQVSDLGESTSPNIEKMIEIGTNVIIASPFENSSYGAVEKLAIPIIEGADYMESHPLGRTEWLKFYSLMFGKKALGDSLFNKAEIQYNKLKDLVATNSSKLKKVSVLSEKLYGAQWYVPCADSYLSRMYKDAGADYAFSDIKGTGSVPLSFETVLDKAINVDIWLIKYNSPQDITYSDLKSEYQPYCNFMAFKNKRVYGCNTGKKPYYLEITINPHYLLGDLIAIFYPQLLPNYSMRYFAPLK